jgi:hypothetical protein
LRIHDIEEVNNNNIIKNIFGIHTNTHTRTLSVQICIPIFNLIKRVPFFQNEMPLQSHFVILSAYSRTFSKCNLFLDAFFRLVATHSTVNKWLPHGHPKRMHTHVYFHFIFFVIVVVVEHKPASPFVNRIHTRECAITT